MRCKALNKNNKSIYTDITKLKNILFSSKSLWIGAALSLSLTACGTNPVTHKSEIQFVSESSEINIGKQNYAPARQAQGGDYIIDPELTTYVQSVGNKLAAVSDRKLPYEFVVINDSVPNAWAMPGGKIAFNRGLLYQLNSEAELAAVLGHEIVHAAARHGAKSMERGVFLQGAMLAVGLATQDSNYANLIVGGSQLGMGLVTTKYGRDAESEADLYGMDYMKRAGYDPSAAVTLQETFVRLSKDQKSNFLTKLFASHPPSQERVNANKLTLARLGAGGETGKDIFTQKVAALKATEPAYKAYDDGVKALAKKDTANALTLANQAIKLQPREARFQELLGDIALTQKKPTEALAYYNKAIQMQPEYFKPHVQAGITLYNMGRKAEAEPYLKKANSLLPTAPAHLYLGELAEARGDLNGALQNYQIAAGSNSEIGKISTQKYLTLDLPRNPQKYLQAGVDIDARGNLYAVVRNPTPVGVGRVQIRVVQLDAKTGRVVGQSQPLLVRSVAAQQQANVAVGAQITNQNELRNYRVVVERAELAN